MSSPTTTHLNAAEQVIKYLNGTSALGITYSPKGNRQLEGYSDSDYASDPDDRKSISGSIYFLAGGAVSWNSHRQSVVAQSSTEAEYVALGQHVQQGLYLKHLILSVHFSVNVTPFIIYEDNNGAIALASDWIFRKRTKHIEVKYHLVRYHVLEKNILLQYTPTDNMVADALTKQLSFPSFSKFRSIIMGL
jgi:hypothetical protein